MQSSLQSALFSKLNKEVSVVKLSAIWKQHFSTRCLEIKKQTNKQTNKQTRDCLIDIMYF